MRSGYGALGAGCWVRGSGYGGAGELSPFGGGRGRFLLMNNEQCRGEPVCSPMLFHLTPGPSPKERGEGREGEKEEGERRERGERGEGGLYG